MSNSAVGPGSEKRLLQAGSAISIGLLKPFYDWPCAVQLFEKQNSYYVGGVIQMFWSHS